METNPPVLILLTPDNLPSFTDQPSESVVRALQGLRQINSPEFVRGKPDARAATERAEAAAELLRQLGPPPEANPVMAQGGPKGAADYDRFFGVLRGAGTRCHVFAYALLSAYHDLMVDCQDTKLDVVQMGLILAAFNELAGLIPGARG